MRDVEALLARCQRAEVAGARDPDAAGEADASRMHTHVTMRTSRAMNVDRGPQYEREMLSYISTLCSMLNDWKDAIPFRNGQAQDALQWCWYRFAEVRCYRKGRGGYYALRLGQILEVNAWPAKKETRTC